MLPFRTKQSSRCGTEKKTACRLAFISDLATSRGCHVCDGMVFLLYQNANEEVLTLLLVLYNIAACFDSHYAWCFALETCFLSTNFFLLFGVILCWTLPVLGCLERLIQALKERLGCHVRVARPSHSIFGKWIKIEKRQHGLAFSLSLFQSRLKTVLDVYLKSLSKMFNC